ncbi:sigma-54 dependent transcriptional regulator [Bacteroidales bacterium OttesenSCG-928-B11]|nr:sigma-54 dependent transcriptional regulator [Bacteroidales bacterium OttesenSCG-928-E04]MDL2309186.1 sigma-54 dependent transcriptional regulator [Bacteroidales bacterium OttesenSCG-928-C03]MDL2312062.1 sigma-54 dependent transcriptional regulator [Bacteroidales bacterium OttesenSCG-928-B11]MDL2325672.1 sigma-54 dependent transcriptional regulator [Bacteroidales bacterium OttesenSCG-928-A14]
MPKWGTILIADDNKSILAALELFLAPYFSTILTTSNPNNIKSLLSDRKIDIILLDMNYSAGRNSGNEGLFWLNEIKKNKPEIPVVLFTAYADVELAVRGMKEGAADFVVKPWVNEHLLEKLKNAISANKKCRSASSSAPMYWGENEKMQTLAKMVEKIAPTQANVLITGESGIGKGVLANEIHLLSSRKGKPFLQVDVGTISDTLFESELFGHVKGAFTDAKTERIGKFEEANGGTLFLDEIANLSLSLQAKILTAIQQKSIVRVGSNAAIPVDVRLIFATNRNLQEMVAEGLFREDLFFRINTIEIEIPPLRQRKEDILSLARIFIKKYTAFYQRPDLHLSEDAEKRLGNYHWPGNIRELESMIEKAVILCDTAILSSSLFHFQKMEIVENQNSTTLEEMEVEMIRKAIAKCNGNLSAVAKELGITRQTLYNKMKKYEI